MKYEKLAGIAVVTLAVAVLVTGTQLAAQAKHSRYIFRDLGTFSGPNSNVNTDSVVINKDSVVVGGADTSLFNPACGCLDSHAFAWQKDVLTDLGTLPGGSNSFAIAINSRGVVVGASENGDASPLTGTRGLHATVWRNGKVTDLGTFGGMFSIAGAINDRDQIVGAAENTMPDPFGFGAQFFGAGLPSTTEWHASLWQNGRREDLGTLGYGRDSGAAFVNERGQIVGASFTNSTVNPSTGLPTVAPFLWENGRMENLGTLGGVLGTTSGLNNRGQVVGTSNWPGDQTAHPFLWERGSLRDLGTLGGTFGAANWINDSGEVIGGSTTINNEAFDGFLWRKGVMTDLGSVAGDGCSNAFGINSRGQIVGESFSCSVDSHHAFLWENGGPAIDLNIFVPPDLGLQLTEAQFIGEGGEIAGVALLANGDAHAFLLIPDDKDETADSESAIGPGEADAALVAQRPIPATQGKLTQEKLAALRARFARRNRGFGVEPSK